jgi:RES domain-containing protein
VEAGSREENALFSKSYTRLSNPIGLENAIVRKLWRISNYADLAGYGGVRFAGRWHSKGRPIVYCAEHPAAALAEFLVHLDREDFPDTFRLLTIEIDEPHAVERLDMDGLPQGWFNDLPATRGIGDDWLARRSTLLLEVPSVLVPDAWNVLLNPASPEMAQARVIGDVRVPLDPRLG